MWRPPPLLPRLRLLSRVVRRGRRGHSLIQTEDQGHPLIQTEDQGHPLSPLVQGEYRERSLSPLVHPLSPLAQGEHREHPLSRLVQVEHQDHPLIQRENRGHPLSPLVQVEHREHSLIQREDQDHALIQRENRGHPLSPLVQVEHQEHPLSPLVHPLSPLVQGEHQEHPLIQRKDQEHPLSRLFQRKHREHLLSPLVQRKHRGHPLHGQGWGLAQQVPPRRFVSSKPPSRGHRGYPVLDGRVLAVHRHVFEQNLRNSEALIERYSELLERVRRGGGEGAILRHTQRNQKLFVRERLKLLLDEEPFLELSPLAGLAMPYGDVPAAGCLTGIGKICGIWCVFLASDATVKGGTIYPIGVKKQLRAQEIALENRLPSVHLVDSGGAFLPLQAELFPDKLHGGRIFYNEAIMSALGIPQVAVVCGSCVAGGAYVPTMAEEAVIIDRIGTLFLAGPPLVKAATGEDVTPEELGGARLHSQYVAQPPNQYGALKGHGIHSQYVAQPPNQYGALKGHGIHSQYVAQPQTSMEL